MRPILFASLTAVALFAAGLCAAEPEIDMTREAEMAERFAPFDTASGAGWDLAFPTPFYRSAGNGDEDTVTLELAAGSYMIVGLCNCAAMDIALVGPDGTAVQPTRSSGQAAMFSLDVTAPGDWSARTIMTDCAAGKCGVAWKAYKKK